MTQHQTPAPSKTSAHATPFVDLGVAVSPGEPLAHHTWLGVGGPAAYFCEPVDAEALARAMREHLMNTWPRIEQAAQRAAEGY